MLIFVSRVEVMPSTCLDFEVVNLSFSHSLDVVQNVTTCMVIFVSRAEVMPTIEGNIYYNLI